MRTKVIIENGNVTFDAQDGIGTQCSRAHQPLVEALAKRFEGTTSQERKPEYYQAENDQQTDLLTE